MSRSASSGATVAPASSSAPWRPLLEGEPAERARDAVLAIARALRDPSGLGEGAGGPDLSRGYAGRAVFFTYLARALEEPVWLEAAGEALDAAVSTLAEQPVGPELFGGFAGVGWALQHLAGRLFPAEEAADATEQIDEVLLELLDGRWEGTYDLIGGLAGFGLYALEGLPRPGAGACLAGVVAELDRRAEPRGRGRTWFTPLRLLPEQQRAAAPEGYYNLGVAHGVAGVIVVLARAYASSVKAAGVKAPGVGKHRAGASVPDPAAAVAWLLDQDQGPRAESCFANWVLPTPAAETPAAVSPAAAQPVTTRLAWCYGDLGIAAVLRVAAAATGRQAWGRIAVEIARRAAARPAERTGVQDAGVCHGAAGLALIFHRFAVATGDALFEDAARRAYEEVLDLRRPGEGVGGFLSWAPSRGGWEVDGGFLTGAAGVGLTLLAGLAPIEPEWDRALGISMSAEGGETASTGAEQGAR